MKFSKKWWGIKILILVIIKNHMKSGGYLIFDQTEAMTTIDVNTGGYVGHRIWLVDAAAVVIVPDAAKGINASWNPRCSSGSKPFCWSRSGRDAAVSSSWADWGKSPPSRNSA